MTLFCTAEGEKHAHLVIESLRAFGGNLRQAPVWVFSPDPDHLSPAWTGLTDIHPFRLADAHRGPYWFTEKVAACAQAERMARGKFQSLVWLNLDSLIVNPPKLFDLGGAYKAAFRPVHIQNIGSKFAEPLDDFWKAIYGTVGVDQASFTIQSYVDEQILRPYFNTHCFAANPQVGLFGVWLEVFDLLVSDSTFQSNLCSDEAHQIFLHQAVLSALIIKMVEEPRLRLLPPEYSYPLHLHPQIPPARRYEILNRTVCPVYEDVFRYPDALNGLPVLEPLHSWLMRRMPSAQAGE